MKCFAIFCALALGACSSGTGFGVATTVTFADTVIDSLVASVTSLDLEVSGDETFTRTISLGRAPRREERFVYRPGPDTRNLVMLVRALDGDAAVVAAGAATVSVFPGQTAAAEIVLSMPADEPDLSVGDGTVVDAGTPDAAPTIGVYGAGVGTDSRDGLTLSTQAVAQRFRASASSNVTSVAWGRRTGGGYSLGTGGTVRITLQTDDGTTQHGPSGVVLASLTYAGFPLTTPDVNVKLAFSTPAQVTAGQLYHVVWENTDPSPASNYIALAALYSAQSPPQRQPAWPNVDFGVLTRSGAGSWTERPNHTPIIAVLYEDGTVDGNAYFSSLVGSKRTVGGTAFVRESFTVTGPDRLVTEAHVRLSHQSGARAVTVRLEDGAGTLIEEGLVDNVPDTSAWVGLRFASPHVLVSASTYHLVLSSPPGTQLTMVPIQHTQDNGTDGSGDPNRSNLTSRAFRDGRGEFSTDSGATWAPMYAFSPENMQFYFVTESP